MARKPEAREEPRPTAAELEILRVLWRQGPGTVRQIHEGLAQTARGGKTTSYNTTLKFLQIMHDKGFARRDESQRPQVYRAVLPEAQMQGRLVGDLLARAFGGSARKLLTALTSTDISADEIAEIRSVLAALEDKKQ